MTKVTQRHLWQAVSISAFCYLLGSMKKAFLREEVVEGARVILNLY